MNGIVLLVVEVTGVFAAALLGLRLASGARAAVRHLILASAFGIALILPLAQLLSPTIVVEFAALPARSADPVAATPVVVAPVEVEPRSTGNIPAALTAVPANPAGPIPAATLLVLVWAVVALLALVPVGASLAHLRSIRRRGQLWPEGAVQMNEFARAAGMRPPLVLIHDGIAGPVTNGFLRPLIALPASAMTWSQTHVANALIHELEHVRRRDWPVHLIARTVCALLWFHPLAWIAWRALRLEAERACDDAVLAREDAAAYAEQLVELARHLAHKPAPAALSMAGSSDLSTRIRSVLDNMRPRGRAGKVVIACTVLAAVVAVAVLAPLRASATVEKRFYRATEVLAKQADADSLAAAGLLGYRTPRDQSLRLVAQASLMAPERADLVWLHIQLCERDAACDPEALESRLQILDEKNGAGWLGALARASKRDDEEAKAAALVAIARSERMDIYWTTLVARLSPRVAGTRTAPLHEAQTWVIGNLAALAIPGLGYMSAACKRERLTQDDVVEACRGVANSLLNGDSFLMESMGASMAQRLWPRNSAKWVEVAEGRRKSEYRRRSFGETEAWMRAHGSDVLQAFQQHRREQEVFKALLIAMGKNPDPAPGQ